MAQSAGAKVLPPLDSTARQRQYASYAHDEVTKETHLTSPSNAYHSLPYGNGTARPRSPFTAPGAEPPLLSSAFQELFRTARAVLAARTGVDSATLLQAPDASTVGFICLCGLWYLSSAFSSNTGKSILTRFRYPVTLTFVQFAFVSSYSVCFLAARERYAAFANAAGGGGGHSHGRKHSIVGGGLSTLGIRKPSRTMLQGTFMMSLFQIAGHVFSSMAIARVPVSTVHTIKALSPLFTVASYAVLFRVRYSPPTYIALAPLTLGVMLACSFDFRANAFGFLCALGSTVIFVSQNIFSKKLLPKESTSGLHLSQGASGAPPPGRLDKLNLLFYSSGMAFVLMVPIWLWSDAAALLASGPATTQRTYSMWGLVGFFFLNGVVHFAQNLLAFSILARTSPVTYSIASLVKRIAVICIAIIWSGQTVSFVQGVGMTMTFAGLWMYNRAKSDVDKGEQKRGQVEKRHDMLLPSTVEDARDLAGSPAPQAQQQHQQQQNLPPYGNGHAYRVSASQPPLHRATGGAQGQQAAPPTLEIVDGSVERGMPPPMAQTGMARNRSQAPGQLDGVWTGPQFLPQASAVR